MIHIRIPPMPVSGLKGSWTTHRRLGGAEVGHSDGSLPWGDSCCDVGATLRLQLHKVGRKPGSCALRDPLHASNALHLAGDPSCGKNARLGITQNAKTVTPVSMQAPLSDGFLTECLSTLIMCRRCAVQRIAVSSTDPAAVARYFSAVERPRLLLAILCSQHRSKPCLYKDFTISLCL